MIEVSELAKKLRISHDKLNSDLQDNIEACVLDLQRVGVDVSLETSNKLVDKAIELYCKADFDYQGKGENFRKNYEKLRDSMSLCKKILDEDNQGGA